MPSRLQASSPLRFAKLFRLRQEDRDRDVRLLTSLNMHLAALFTKILFLRMPHYRQSPNTTDVNAQSASIVSLTRHTQLTPYPLIEAPSTTMLATMPCTPFPGRHPHAFEWIIMDHLTTSIVDPADSLARMISRRRPEKRVAVSTYDLEGLMIVLGRELRMVEIVFVEWLVLCWLEIEEGKG